MEEDDKGRHNKLPLFGVMGFVSFRFRVSCSNKLLFE